MNQILIMQTSILIYSFRIKNYFSNLKTILKRDKNYSSKFNNVNPKLILKKVKVTLNKQISSSRIKFFSLIS